MQPRKAAVQIFPPSAAPERPTADKRAQPPGSEERPDAADGAGPRTDPGARSDACLRRGESRCPTCLLCHSVEWFLRSADFNYVFSLTCVGW